MSGSGLSLKSLRNRIPENRHPGAGPRKTAPDFFARKYSLEYSAQYSRCVPADQRQCARGDAQAVRACRVKQQTPASASGICPCKYTHPPGAWSKAGAGGMCSGSRSGYILSALKKFAVWCMLALFGTRVCATLVSLEKRDRRITLSLSTALHTHSQETGCC